MKNILRNYYLSNYGFIAFAVLAIFCIPATLYLFNAKEFNFDVFLLSFPISALVIVLVLGMLFWMIGRLFHKQYSQVNQLVQNTLVAIGLAIFINDFMVPTQARHLDGTTEAIPESWLLSGIELAVIAVIMILLFLSARNKKIQQFFVSIGSYSLILFLLLNIAIIYTTVSFVPKDSKSLVNQENSPNAFEDKLPNIYLLWLDSMQTDYFLKGVDEYELSDDLAGFTLFEHNISNYLYTMRSYKSFMTGTLYKGGDYDKWYGRDVLRETLRDNGYHLTSYARSDYISKLDHQASKLDDIFADDLAVKHPYFKDYLTLSLVRMAPNFLANEARSFGSELAEKYNPIVNPNQSNSEVNSIETGMHVYTSTKIYDKSTAEEYKRKSYGEFVLKQVILPHAPYVLDENCAYVGVRERVSSQIENDKYFQQVGCSLKLINAFFETLKKLDRFEDSLIIVMGDHGDGRKLVLPKNTGKTKEKNRAKKKFINKAFMSWDEGQILDRAAALLMIKPPGKPQFLNLQVSKKETQHIDLVPSVLNILNLPLPDDLDGRDVFSVDEGKRESILTYYKPQYHVVWDTAEVYHIDYDPVKGRSNLEYIDLLNNYFSK